MAPIGVDPNNPRVAKALIAGKYNGVEIDLVPVEMGVTNKTPEYLKKFPLGKVPAFESASGFTLYESNAIAYYVASYKEGTQLLGANKEEAARIQQFIALSDNEINPAAITWLGPVLGRTVYNEQNTKKATEDIKKVLGGLNEHLLHNTYLVGENITLADITLAISLINFYRLVFDPAFRAPYKSVTRWFTTIVNQANFKDVLGDIPLCEKAQGPVEDAPKKEKKEEKKKEEKREANDEDEDDMAAYQDEKPKEKNPLDLLPKSNFNLEEWKRFYSNNDTRPTAMNWFWEKFDPEGFCIYRLDYKYNNELTLTFMSSNLVGGFYHRLEAARKYAFGSLAVLGKDNDNSISGYFVYRGQEVPFAVRDCPDYESWTFTKVDHNDPTQRELFAAYLAWDDVIEGKKFADAKVFK
ncbi:hypothetical protein DFJ73DRAFT_789482 [Zopfochytrium polystomum]|nr:hypothetical protein DFJ73DRAFT_789482 [Zopfochytrium polystomum]